MNSVEDFELFKETLRAAAYGPFFPDWEFHTLFGLERSAFRALADAFTPNTVIVGDVELALRGAMNNLLGYPHGQEATWSEWLSVSPGELQTVFSRFRSARNVA